MTTPAAPKATHQDAWAEAAELRRRAEAAEVALGALKDQLADIRSQRDAWQQQAERLALPTPVPKRWFWSRRSGLMRLSSRWRRLAAKPQSHVAAQKPPIHPLVIAARMWDWRTRPAPAR
jgi:hypothetical protein